MLSCWNFQLLSLIGGGFGDYNDQVCGAFIVIKPKNDRIGIWTKNSLDKDAIMHIGWLCISLFVVSKCVFFCLGKLSSDVCLSTLFWLTNRTILNGEAHTPFSCLFQKLHNLEFYFILFIVSFSVRFIVRFILQVIDWEFCSFFLFNIYNFKLNANGQLISWFCISSKLLSFLLILTYSPKCL